MAQHPSGVHRFLKGHFITPKHANLQVLGQRLQAGDDRSWRHGIQTNNEDKQKKYLLLMQK